jgi:putative restriction endonuclease
VSERPSAVEQRLASLRLHQQNGRRSPHKPLLVLLALGRFAATGSSELPWSAAETELARLIAEFGPATRTSQAQRAAYPFTRLRSDGVWQLDHEVPMDLVRPLVEHEVVGRFESSLEEALRAEPDLVLTAARGLVSSHFPDTVAPDVLAAVGLDPDTVLRTADTLPDPEATSQERRRRRDWRLEVLQAWDDQCAFCGYDGRLNGIPTGVEAAHVRWFAFGGPETLDNGLALCMLHHKLFDRGALGLDDELRVQVSRAFTARTDAGRAVYDLHGRVLRPRPGTLLPASEHVSWHGQEVFKGNALAA